MRCHTGDERFDRLMRWVSFQPLLRRIYGCSFLPHHDYGRGAGAGGICGRTVCLCCSWTPREWAKLAALLRELAARGQDSAPLLEEIQELLAAESQDYRDIKGKKDVLDRYTQRCCHSVSGETVDIPLDRLADDLEGKADWIMAHIRAQEWVADGQDGWFNSYYDNSGRPLEGVTENGVRMMLTGQVFAIMSGTATDEQAAAIARSADKYLYQREIGGYRLNTDFHELKFDMGQMFGFAYGEKENGAVFSHMTVMYANALYRRGFVREGYKALQTLADAALNFETSRIYPGIPEYFSADGRGMYHYLTGAASWYMMTVITQAFGVRGERGDLVVEPKLVREQFGPNRTAAIDLPFAGREFHVAVSNPSGREFGQYRIAKAYLSSPAYEQARNVPIVDGRAVLRREELLCLPEQGNVLQIKLM